MLYFYGYNSRYHRDRIWITKGNFLVFSLKRLIISGRFNLLYSNWHSLVITGQTVKLFTSILKLASVRPSVRPSVCLYVTLFSKMSVPGTKPEILFQHISIEHFTTILSNRIMMFMIASIYRGLTSTRNTFSEVFTVRPPPPHSHPPLDEHFNL